MKPFWQMGELCFEIRRRGAHTLAFPWLASQFKASLHFSAKLRFNRYTRDARDQHRRSASAARASMAWVWDGTQPTRSGEPHRAQLSALCDGAEGQKAGPGQVGDASNHPIGLW